MNSITLIQPYKLGNIWVFDDPRFDLVAEPFVGDVNKIIDLVCENKKIVTEGKINILFSKEAFPGHDIRLEHIVEESGGDWYRFEDIEGWLCPCLRLYFPLPPKNIYIKIDNY